MKEKCNNINEYSGIKCRTVNKRGIIILCRECFMEAVNERPNGL